MAHEIGKLPPERRFQVGDRVTVDLSGMAFGYCDRCEDEVLTLPQDEGWWCCTPGCGATDVLRLRDITEDDITYPEEAA